MKLREYFTRRLMDWHERDNVRHFPWVREKDPYRIWLSEVILQQTRAEQGLPYYNRFIKAFPDVAALARADETLVFRYWQGLGYYNRCRNLIATAKEVHSVYGGVFPRTYEGLLSLKGVGPYTAAAIASFAFGLPHAVLDGNVFRVLSRFFGMDTPIDSGPGKRAFGVLSAELLDRNRPGAYNQAIMDFGAVVCQPKGPDCNRCPLAGRCEARSRNLVGVLPVKARKQPKRERFFQYALLAYRGTYFVRQRQAGDIWPGLFELYGLESRLGLAESEAWASLAPHVANAEFSLFRCRQVLSHQIIHSEFHRLDLKSRPDALTDGQWLKAEDLGQLAFPKTILSFLKGMPYSYS